MDVKIIKCLKDNYSYLVIDEKNQSACVIDPSEAKPIIKFLEKNKIVLRYILNTPLITLTHKQHQFMQKE